MAGVVTPPSLHAVQDGANPSTSNSSLPDAPSSSFPLPAHVPCTPSNLENYLHATPVPGLHVVCVEPINESADGTVHAFPETDDISRKLSRSNSLRLTFYKDAHAAPLKRRVKVSGDTFGPGGVESIEWLHLKMQLIMELGLAPEGPTQQPWAAFTASGERIVGENDDVSKDGDGIGSNERTLRTIAASGMMVVVQGGNWVWPGVREGFRRTIELAFPPSSDESRNITIETLSLRPLVLSVEGFLTEDECDHIAEKAGPSMKYSSVSLKDADRGRAASDWRTSQSTFLLADNDRTLKNIERRTGSLTRVPRSHQEYVQVLRYGTGEKYDAHHDYFDPVSYKSDKGTLNLIQNGKKNRFATVFWYLTDVDEGGHTVFPRAGGLPPVRDHSDCSRGLRVQPQKGKVIIFYSLDASGALDPLSLHGACPVGEDNVKWAANKWIWNAPMGFVRD